MGPTPSVEARQPSLGGHRRAVIVFGSFLLLATIAEAFGAPNGAPTPAVVLAERETEPLAAEGDVADDPCIWIHPTDAGQSLIVCTEKRHGLMVYDLEGKLIQELAGGDPNNIDNRTGLAFGQGSLDIFVAGDRKTNALAFWSINPATRRLYILGQVKLEPAVKVYGSCFYRSRKSGAWYAFVTSKNGDLQQWEITFVKTEHSTKPTPKGNLVRRLKLGTQTEGCVADDELGWLYVAEEKVGIWRFDAAPDGTAQPELVDRTLPDGHLVPDVEGLAIYRGKNGTGYLLASSQGSDSFAVYDRGPKNKFLGQFTIGKGASTDAVSATDGIEVAGSNLGPPFTEGLFVAQDGANDVGHQNFKLVPWKNIATTFHPALELDSSTKQPTDAAK